MSYPDNSPPYNGGQSQIIQDQPQGSQQSISLHVLPSVVIGQQMGTKPSVAVCNNCNHHIVTKTQKKATIRTHVIACLLCLSLCWPCVCVPYCMRRCNNIDHYCPKCDNYIGSYYVSFS